MTLFSCKSFGCNQAVAPGVDFCDVCTNHVGRTSISSTPSPDSISARYSKYYKAVGELTEIDVYAVHKLFEINDPSGAIQHASKKLLLSGARTGGKSIRKDISEARDTLSRWLELNPEE